MKKVLIGLCFIAVILVLALAGPQTPAQDPRPPETATTESEAPDTEPLETFEPTEKLSADSAVSFPVDI